MSASRRGLVIPGPLVVEHDVLVLSFDREFPGEFEDLRFVVVGSPEVDATGAVTVVLELADGDEGLRRLVRVPLVVGASGRAARWRVTPTMVRSMETQQLHLARLLQDPATEDEARKQLAELADLIGNYETWQEGRWMESLARVRELYAHLFGQ